MPVSTDQTIAADALTRECEARGFESLWFPEHSHIPTRRATPWGGREGAPPLPEFYWRTFDPFVTLGAVAAVTSTLKIATGICLVAQRDPIHTAKEVASVDALSNGRAVLGIGTAYEVQDFKPYGFDMPGFRPRPEWVREMASDAIVFACANPVPEIWPDEAREAGARIVATGRCDLPNQVNNSLAFPGIFRGALDVRAREITDQMAIAAARAFEPDAMIGLGGGSAIDVAKMVAALYDGRQQVGDRLADARPCLDQEVAA